MKKNKVRYLLLILLGMLYIGVPIRLEQYTSSFLLAFYRSDISSNLLNNTDANVILDFGDKTHKVIWNEESSNDFIFKVYKYERISSWFSYLNPFSKTREWIIEAELFSPAGASKGIIKWKGGVIIKGFTSVLGAKGIEEKRVRKVLIGYIKKYLRTSKDPVCDRPYGASTSDWTWKNLVDISYEELEKVETIKYLNKKCLLPGRIIAIPNSRGNTWIDTFNIKRFPNDRGPMELVYNVIEVDVDKNEALSKMYYEDWSLGFEGKLNLLSEFEADGWEHEFMPHRKNADKKGTWKMWDKDSNLLFEF